MQSKEFTMTKELYDLLIRPRAYGGEGLKNKNNVIKHLNSLNKGVVITDIKLV